MIRSPFPWFGGKSRAAPIVLGAIGDPHHYVEPFAGSLAVLLAGQPRPLETVNDVDGHLVNFWRAAKHRPMEMAEFASGPVAEIDLFARHLRLHEQRQRLLDGLHADPEWCDPKLAGWWVHGQSAWLGSGWCNGGGRWQLVDGVPADTGRGTGVGRALPSMGNPRGVLRERDDLPGYIQALAERLRHCRIVCGDWSRVCTQAALLGNGIGYTAVFFDPPYDDDTHDAAGLYKEGGDSIASDVVSWCQENGGNPKLRIVMASYSRYLPLDGWTSVAWESKPSYQSSGSDDSGTGSRANYSKETLWLSPHCTGPAYQPSMF